MQLVVLVALLLIGTLMVSTFRYNSFKKLDLKRRWSFRALVPFAAILLVVVFFREAILLVIAFIFARFRARGRPRERLRSGGAPRTTARRLPLSGAPP